MLAFVSPLRFGVRTDGFGGFSEGAGRAFFSVADTVFRAAVVSTFGAAATSTTGALDSTAMDFGTLSTGVIPLARADATALIGTTGVGNNASAAGAR